MKKFFSHPLFALALLCGTGLLCYSRILHAPFQFDDHEFLLYKPFIRDVNYLLANWDDVVINKRKILTFLTFAFNYQFHGEDTFGYHLVNLLLHLASGCLLYHILVYLGRTPHLAGTIFFQERHRFALLASLIFVVHPLQTQAVTYIWQRAEVLSGFFYLLAYSLYLQGRFKKNFLYDVGALAVFYIGLFAKGTIITLPLLVILTELSFFENEKIRRNGVFLIAIFLVTLLIFLLLWRRGFLFHLLEKVHVGFLLRFDQPGIDWEYLLTQFRAIVLYIQLSFLPLNQNIDHFFPFSKSFWEPATLLSFLALMAIFMTTVSLYRRKRWVAFGIAWFFIYLIPTSSGLASLEPVMEHRLYISMAGFAIFLVALLFEIIPEQRVRNSLLILSLVLLSGLTLLRNEVWRSQKALMEDSIKKAPHNSRTHTILGALYLQEGNLPKAFEFLHKAILITPDYPEAHNNLGAIYIQLGQWDKAEQEFYTIIRIYPTLPYSYGNLGYIAWLRGQKEQAEEFLFKSLKAKVTPQAAGMLAGVYFEQGKLEEAEKYFQLAAEVNPFNEKAYLGLGVIAQRRGDLAKAEAMFKKAAALQPRPNKVPEEKERQLSSIPSIFIDF